MFDFISSDNLQFASNWRSIETNFQGQRIQNYYPTSHQ